jgi:hypothetical protein
LVVCCARLLSAETLAFQRCREAGARGTIGRHDPKGGYACTRYQRHPTLAEFAAVLSCDDLPEPAISRLKQRILEALGCCPQLRRKFETLAGAVLPQDRTAKIIEVVHSLGNTDARMLTDLATLDRTP